MMIKLAVYCNKQNINTEKVPVADYSHRDFFME